MRRKEEDIIRQKKQRQLYNAKRDFVTGRQLEQQRKAGAEGGTKLTPDDMREFDKLFKQELCASRKSICEAMAFCFEKSIAATQISTTLLKQLLMDVDPTIGVETMIARLFLLSDVLFNSQQPGVRNAFHYRDAIQRMSPELFTSLGVYKGRLPGRMSQERLTTGLNAVLAAWTNWGVFDPALLDELETRFQGKEIVRSEKTEVKEEEANKNEGTNDHDGHTDFSAPVLYDKPKGDWITVTTDNFEEAYLVLKRICRISVMKELNLVTLVEFD